MFKLHLFDTKGERLSIGDIVKVKGNTGSAFYTHVKFSEKDQSITPFSTFCFHAIEKVSEIPEGAVLMKTSDGNHWYSNDNSEYSEEGHSEYLESWFTCSQMISKGCFRIEIDSQPQPESKGE